MPELLPPEPSTVLTTEPQLKLWHLPLAMAWLGGIVAFAAVLITVALLAEAIAAFVAIAAIATLLLVCFPLLFWKVYRMRQAESSHR